MNQLMNKLSHEIFSDVIIPFLNKSPTILLALSDRSGNPVKRIMQTEGHNSVQNSKCHLDTL